LLCEIILVINKIPTLTDKIIVQVNNIAFEVLDAIAQFTIAQFNQLLYRDLNFVKLVAEMFTGEFGKTESHQVKNLNLIVNILRKVLGYDKEDLTEYSDRRDVLTFLNN